MNKYSVWVRLNALQTTHTIVFASDALSAKRITEQMFGVGNVLNYTEIK
jgi:hypothetical protein